MIKISPFKNSWTDHTLKTEPQVGFFFLYNVQDWDKKCKVNSVIQDFSKCPNFGIP